MPQVKNNRLLKALARQPVDMTPIWLMRQAGRYLPEYRKTRERVKDFMTFAKTPELACEVTLQPLKRFDLDAAIIFSDILTIPDAMGFKLQFVEGLGPQFGSQCRDERAIKNLPPYTKDALGYVYEAIRLVSQELQGNMPLIGFCGSPWTVAAYMIEGKSQPGFPLALELLKNNPTLLHSLLNHLANWTAAHLQGQIEAGADIVMLFDTWGGLLDTQSYEKFSLFYIQQIINDLRSNYNKSKIPIILFTKGGNKWLPQMVEAGCDALGLDWEISLQNARKQVGNKVALQGNLNPAVLLESPQVIRETAQQVITSFGKGAGHIFNLGHGITPDVAPEKVAILIDTVHEFSQHFHATE